MKKYHCIVLILYCLFLIQCKKPGCLENTGKLTTVKRTTLPFKQIALYNNINLILTQDFEETITVEANEGVQPNISIAVENEQLTIKNNSSCNWLKNPHEKINVHVTVKKLERLNYEGSGLVTSTNIIKADAITIHSEEGAGNINLHLNANTTTVHLQGENADLTLRGKSNHCSTFIHSRGSINFVDFEVKDMYIGYTSVRDAVINVTEQLTATIYHTGNLFYKGNPTSISPTFYSSGRLFKAP